MKKANLLSAKFVAFGIVAVLFIAAVVLAISSTIQLHQIRSQNHQYLESINELQTNIAHVTERLDQMDSKLNDTIKKMNSSRDDTKNNENTDTSNLVLESYDVQITAEEGLRVRREPSITSEIITVIPYQTIVTVTDAHTSSWYQLNTDEYYENGYIFKDYTTTNIQEISKATELSSSNTMDITTPSNLSAEEFNSIIEAFAEDRSISNSVLIGTGDALVALEENYQFNGLFALSVAGLESGFGITKAAMNSNNPLGIMGGGKVTSFDSIHDAFNNFGSFMSKNYINNGRTTISSIGAKYCPGTASKWAEDVNWFWNKLTAYV